MKTLILLFSVLFTTMSFAQVPSYVPNSGLVGWWPFNGNANDESGNGNNGTVNGATLTADRNGVANQAYSFDPNSNSNINIPFSSSLNSIQNGITLSAWIYMDGGSPAGTPPRILELRGAYGGGGDAGFVMLATDNNNSSRAFELRWYSNNGNSNLHFSPTNSTLTSLNWHLISFTADGIIGVAKYYFDGVLQSTSTNDIITQCNYNNNPLIIGSSNTGGNWGGKLDDIGIWNRALTQQEITNLYTSTVPPTAAVLSGDATICTGSSINLSVAVTGGTAPYTVTVTDGTNNYSATGASPLSIPVSPISTSTYTIVSVTGGGTGTGNTGTATISINQNPIVSDQVLTLCSDIACGLTLGDDINGPSASTYNIININSNGLSSSAGTPLVANGVSNSNLIDDAWTNTANAAVDVIYTIVPVSAVGCEGTPFTVTLTVNPEPIVSNQVLTVCSDVACGLTLGDDIDGPTASTYNILSINSNGLIPSAGTPLVANGVSNSNLIDDAWTNTTNSPVDVIYTIVPISAAACEGSPFTVTITVNALPTAIITATGPLTFCSGGSVVLTASGGTSYLWSNGATTASITATTAGSYTVQVTDNVNGCSIITVTAVTVNPNVTPTFTAVGAICSGASLSALPTTSTNGITGTWSPALNNTATTTYTFTPTAGLCATTTTLIITVNTLPIAEITAGGATTFCSGGSVLLTASGGTSYSWSTGATTASITATTSGSYTVQVTDNVNGCISLSAPTVLTITPSSTNTTTTAACDSYTWNGTTYTTSGVYLGTTTNCVTQSLNLTINTNTSSSISQTALDSYTWPVNNQTYTTSGAYTAVIPNASGCDSTITLNLTMSFTGINDLSTSKLSIYPNPTNGDFTITGLELVGTVSSLSLTDMNGKVVKVLDTKATKFTMGSIKPGVYFLNIISGSKQEVLKIVKE